MFDGVWNLLATLANNGDWLSPREVLLELERQKDDTCEWARALDPAFIEVDEAVQNIVGTIVNRWSSFTPTHSDDGVWADPYVIALACSLNATVVTYENPARANAKKPKIPDICSNLGVPCIGLVALLRAEGYRS